ncbi:hypothetical protein SAMN02745194_00970 [Roseomonas rosea]|uniref:Uncharacterized protein n=1 Tax=Muricoccus roseus TaxID=198092 RepID=A0A1M6DJ76_9PROT|nr:hypothetical protein [Roseomonas rosea]SHI73242.1 hypothetical protein SAMN02745194_00970 [Roseomonas rosea]
MPHTASTNGPTFGPRLLVSLPGSWLPRLKIPGSLFGRDALRDVVMPVELRAALALLTQEATARSTSMQFVARPEIFTHGRARAWLDERIGDARDHVALTDGHSLRPIPGLRNHMFFFPRGNPASEQALRNLLRVAPELFAGLASQINGGMAFRFGASWCRPPSLYLRLRQTPESGIMERLPFYCGPLGRQGMQGIEPAPPEEALPIDRPIRYIPLTEAALADTPFLRMVAQEVLEAIFGGPELLLLELPRPEGGAETAGRLETVIRALTATGIVFPRARSWAVQFVTAPPLGMSIASMLLHPGVPFWRYGLDFFDAAQRVEVAGSAAATRFRTLLSAWLERPVGLLRPAAAAGAPRVTVNDVP